MTETPVTTAVPTPEVEFFREEILADECSICGRDDVNVYFVNRNNPEDAIDRDCFYAMKLRERKDYMRIEDVPSETSIVSDEEEDNDDTPSSPNSNA